MSKKLKIERSAGALDITYSWGNPSRWFLAFFSLFWNAFVLFFLAVGAGWFIVFHLIAGAFIGWYTLTLFLNKSVIKASSQELTITHGPIPWFSKDRQIPARAVKQLYVEIGPVKQNNQSTYQLMAQLDTDARVKLIGAEMDKERLLEVEATVERYLGIADDPSMNLSGKSMNGLNLDEVRANLERLQKIKKWLPASMAQKMEEAEHKIAAEAARRSSDDGIFVPGEDWAASSSSGFLKPRILPAPEHDLTFPFYLSGTGDDILLEGAPATVGRTAQLDWDNDDGSISRQLEVVSPGDGGKRHFYATRERGRWTYYEERRLDDNEVAKLGFSEDHHPLRFENGRERYYPRDEKTGRRFVLGQGHPVRQFVYFTSSSTAQFRALKSGNQPWEVYIEEPIDGASFEAKE
ncbi:hypothetical protein [Lewinella sp. W8]|uniref:hypothetical protein n=1 Tax=Lewinella sp. W8 TaxID=2528208 RepID=UPI001068420A|nr:hypothetical protein [Lewinella sp. W8]MTB52640.1 hypothetical protein [Lewinella sp. W8]